MVCGSRHGEEFVVNLGLQVDPRSVAQIEDYLEQTKRNIFANVRVGMRESMEGLASTVASKLQGNPIVSRTGELLAHVLASPMVKETKRYIRGTVDAELGVKHLGLWLEEGTHVPEVRTNKQGGPVMYWFVARDGNSAYAPHGHSAFTVQPHPFLNPSLEEYKPTLLDIIAQKVQESVHGVV
jgi:hypothetical protein